jgi:hypothetical protein
MLELARTPPPTDPKVEDETRRLGRESNEGKVLGLKVGRPFPLERGVPNVVEFRSEKSASCVPNGSGKDEKEELGEIDACRDLGRRE